MVIGNHYLGFEIAFAPPRSALQQLFCSVVVFRPGHHVSPMPLDRHKLMQSSSIVAALLPA